MNIINRINNTSINRNLFNKKNYNISFKNIQKDTVTFSGNRNLPAEIRNLPTESFPSENLKNFIIRGLNESSDSESIVELHKSYYSKLEECTSLDEAKALYPELKKVIDAKELDISKLGHNHILRHISKGEIEGLSLENLSIEFLKRYYMAIPVSNNNRQYYFNISTLSINSILDLLNISFDKKYANILGAQSRKDRLHEGWQTDERKQKQKEGISNFYQNNPQVLLQKRDFMVNLWQQDGYREKVSVSMRITAQTPEEIERKSKAMKKVANTPEHKARLAQASKTRWTNPSYRALMTESLKTRWQNDEYRAHMAEALKQRWSDPEYRKKTVQSIIRAMQSSEYKQKQSINSKKMWQNEEHRLIMQIVNQAAAKAWEMHPFAKKLYSEVAKEFPDLHSAIDKKRQGQPLTKKEKTVRKLFFATCQQKYPNILKEIGEIQKNILREWGFYDDDRDINKLIELINSQDN